jgi:hypothetical protein
MASTNAHRFNISSHTRDLVRGGGGGVGGVIVVLGSSDRSE